MNDSHNWWLVKNFRGRNGYLPSNLLEIVTPRRRGGSRGERYFMGMLPFHTRNFVVCVSVVVLRKDDVIRC